MQRSAVPEPLGGCSPASAARAPV